MKKPKEAQAAALESAENFLNLLVRGFERGHVKAKPLLNIDLQATDLQFVSVHDEAVKCLDMVKKARAQ